jgi:hypothetical protein
MFERIDSVTVKVCQCGRRYSAWTWGQLHLIGLQEFLELRNCRRCSSTLARVVPWVSADPSDYEVGGILSTVAEAA